MEVEGQRNIARLGARVAFPRHDRLGRTLHWSVRHRVRHHDAFTSIAKEQNATLAVVAPGIAEALAATALGLIAAIPAVVFYNKFSGDISTLGARLENFSRELWSTISRELDLSASRITNGRGWTAMAMSAMSSSGWGSRRTKSRFAPASQINVTPFVDVMLVLLIVFMVAAPLMAGHRSVELAKSAAKPKADAAPLTISVAATGTILIGNDPVAKENLVAAIRELSHGATDQRIYLSGAKDVSYQQVMEIMGLIDAAGFSRIGLVGCWRQLARIELALGMIGVSARP